jgi:predicted CXXCH cytochrome family protein
MLKSIPIIVLSALLLLASSAQAITRRADKECLLCHVLWFDVFQTDQKTLLEQKDSSIVIAGSKGLASSEAMCVTCHDGYVVDSRATVVAGNPHHLLEKVQDGLKLPEIFRLDSNNRMYCGTCHTLHDFEDRAEVGSTPFMRMDNQRSQMCIACHQDKTNKQGHSNHPVFKKSNNFPRLEAVKIGSKFGPSQEIICQTCHNAHGRQAMVSPFNNSTLCLICHQNNKSMINAKHDLRITRPDEKNIKQQLPSESGPCGACHIPHQGVGKRLWARRLAPGNQATQMCVSCHGEETAFKIKRIGKHSHPINVKADSKIGIPSELPLYLSNATRDAAGRIQCLTCHEVHRWDPNSPTNKGGKNIEGDSSNSFLRISNRFSSTLCLACHVDKKQVGTSDHNLQVTAPEEKNISGLTSAVSGPCGACHIPHNASGERLWAKPLSGKKDFATQLCSGCHNQNGAAKAKLIGDNYHPVDVTLKNLNITEAAEQALKNLPLYDSDENKTTDDKIVCITCHEPHTWDPKNSKPKLNEPAINIEGDTTNSFLRKANFPSSDLCKICHADEAFLDGTVHDLGVSAPKAANLLGQTVKLSGPCGACHLVHNAPNTLKLWARSYGPVQAGENMMNALCKSCHSKGNLAENKVPLIAIHPGGKLINNIIRFNKIGGNYTHIFDNHGREVNSGNISCPSCHNAHQWSLTFNKKAINKNSKNKGSAAKFLRTASYNTVCIDCHGPEGIFRYLYFHQPDKRIEK